MLEPAELHPLLTLEGRRNPLRVYARLRAEQPVTKVIEPMRNLQSWLVTRHEDCLYILNDPRFGKDSSKLSPDELARSGFTDGLAVLGQHLLGADPPDHTRLRSLISKAFTQQRTEALRPRIKEIAEHLIDQVEGRGEMDLVADFAYLLPVTVIAELLGVPV